MLLLETLSACLISSRPFIYICFTDTPPSQIYTLSLHDALPISCTPLRAAERSPGTAPPPPGCRRGTGRAGSRSEEHTSELQSHSELVCRLLLEKKKYTKFKFEI